MDRESTEPLTTVLENKSRTSSDESSISTPSASTSSTCSKKRKRYQADIVWSYARKPIPHVEAKRTPRSQGARKIWYYKDPKCATYKVTSTNSARTHIRSKHSVILDEEEPSKAAKAAQQDLRVVIGKQAIKKQENEQQLVLKTLRAAVDLVKVQ